MTSFSKNTHGPGTLNYEAVAEQYYEPLQRFALSLTHNSVDASDLVQNAFHTLIQKAAQIRDVGKLKSWLFTTLYRNFLQIRRRAVRFPNCGIESVEEEANDIAVSHIDRIDARSAMACLQELSERYRLPLVLFYKEDKSYQEIAEALGVPIGTVMSRLSRGKLLLRQRLERAGAPPVRNIHWNDGS
ncbi:MAG: RNA polymerase sigma factor [Verrucomicrobia bacterium]|nr:RNA polymerase sigma factor [Verrucomicrobiota bacterium]